MWADRYRPAIKSSTGCPSRRSRGVPEQPLDLRVHEHDAAVTVHDDDRVRGSFEKPFAVVGDTPRQA
jgi:hypothetical protein